MHDLLHGHAGFLLLLGLLVLVMPFLDLPLSIPLRSAPTDEGRVRLYQWIVVYLWAAAALAWVVRGGAGMQVLHAPGDASWLWAAPWRTWTAWVMLVAFFGLLLMPGVVCLLQPRRIPAYTRAVKRIPWLLPHNARQRRWFAVLSVTAGVCEEWILRGVVMHGLHVGLGLSLTAALLWSSLLFGWNHLYQGWRAVLGSGLVGLALGVLALLTGGLLVPMVLHSVMDLQTVVYFRPDRSNDVLQPVPG